MRITKAALAFMIAVFPVLATAAPIAYVYNGVGSGSLNSVPFTNAAFTITAYADTSTVKDLNYPAPGLSLFNFPTVVSITVGGFPTAVANGSQTFLQQMINSNTVAGVSLKSENDTSLFLYFVQSLPFYDLASAYGPYAVTYIVNSPYPYLANNLPTSQGPLSLVNSTPTATFAGVLGALPPPVPLAPSAPIPVSPWWAIVGLLAVTLAFRRRLFG